MKSQLSGEREQSLAWMVSRMMLFAFVFALRIQLDAAMAALTYWLWPEFSCARYAERVRKSLFYLCEHHEADRETRYTPSSHGIQVVVVVRRTPEDGTRIGDTVAVTPDAKVLHGGGARRRLCTRDLAIMRMLSSSFLARTMIKRTH